MYVSALALALAMPDTLESVGVYVPEPMQGLPAPGMPAPLLWIHGATTRPRDLLRRCLLVLSHVFVRSSVIEPLDPRYTPSC